VKQLLLAGGVLVAAASIASAQGVQVVDLGGGMYQAIGMVVARRCGYRRATPFRSFFTGRSYLTVGFKHGCWPDVGLFVASDRELSYADGLEKRWLRQSIAMNC
jgi:hypothetical protein